MELQNLSSSYSIVDQLIVASLLRMGNPKSPVYPFPQTDEDLKEMEEILKRKLGSSGGAV